MGQAHVEQRSKLYYKLWNKLFNLLFIIAKSKSHEAFVATEFNEIFSDRQVRQDVKVLPMFRELTDVITFGATKPPAHHEDEGGSSRNVGKPSHLDAAVCPRKFQ
jgi:hypothetical protein